MDNDDAIVGRIISRRELFGTTAKAGLGFAALGGLGGVLEAQTKAAPHVVASPQMTEGPFFVDEKLNRSDLVAGTKRKSVVDGIPLQLGFSVMSLIDGKLLPLKGAHVDVWQADVIGIYSDESNQMNHEDTSNQRWLRGYQVTDAAGRVSFRTIFPGWYRGRTPHIHFKIRAYSAKDLVTAEFTSQVFFKDADSANIYAKEPYRSAGPRDTDNSSDNIFNERQYDGSTAGSHMLLDLRSASKGYASNFNVALTQENFGAARRRGRG